MEVARHAKGQAGMLDLMASSDRELVAMREDSSATGHRQHSHNRGKGVDG